MEIVKFEKEMAAGVARCYNELVAPVPLHRPVDEEKFAQPIPCQFQDGVPAGSPRLFLSRDGILFCNLGLPEYAQGSFCPKTRRLPGSFPELSRLICKGDPSSFSGL